LVSQCARTPDEDSPIDTTRKFVGTWAYSAPDPESRVNILSTQCVGENGGAPVVSPQQGTVAVEKIDRDTVRARTADGCTWTLAVRGNTALLEPASQTCRTGEATRTLNHWAIASDGRQQATIMSGVEEHPGRRCTFLLSVGSLDRVRA
jgi:hypothetical protein